MRINYQRNQIGMMAVVFSLMAVTLYMAFAFPHSLLHFKQSETTEIKAVIIVGRHGEASPRREAYFADCGEEPPESWFQLGGPDQLTPIGKERMYLLGKFLKLRYYDRLLNGNPRKLFVRAENSDKSLESAQALLAGLNPPRDQWIWSQGSSDGLKEFATSWQPKAVHTIQQNQDELLSSQTKCHELEALEATWKNSSRYAQLLNEFRHDLQVLRQNTRLQLDDDLERLASIEEQLKARSAFDGTNTPSWYTSTFAQRLAHIADVTADCRFSLESSQRLFAGRLLDTIVKNIFSKIRSDLTSGVSLLSGEGASEAQEQTSGSSSSGQAEMMRQMESNLSETTAAKRRASEQDEQVSRSQLLPPEEQLKLKLERQNEPNVFVYMTDKEHLSALMNSLKIYASQPHFGASLIIELHHDPVNQVHFLRLFLVNSASHNVLPEPVRVNPIACLDSVECSPQQFDNNIRHLALDKEAWDGLCSAWGSWQEQQQRPAPTSSPVAAVSTPSELTSDSPATPTSGSIGSLVEEPASSAPE